MLLHPHPLVFHEDHAALKEAGIAVACEAEGPNKVWVEHVILQWQTMLHFADSVIAGGRHWAAHFGVEGTRRGGGAAGRRLQSISAAVALPPPPLSPLSPAHPRANTCAKPSRTTQDKDEIMSK